MAKDLEKVSQKNSWVKQWYLVWRKHSRDTRADLKYLGSYHVEEGVDRIHFMPAKRIDGNHKEAVFSFMEGWTFQ